MAELEITNPDGKVSRFHFLDFLTIGRDRANYLTLDSAQVADIHAALVENGSGSYTLFNLSNHSPVLVGQQKVRTCLLPPGACFELGGFVLQLLNESQEAASDPLVHLSQEVVPGWGESYGAGELDAWSASGFDPQQDHRLGILLALSAQISSEWNYHALLEKVLSLVLECMGGRRGFIALLNEQDELIYQALYGFGENPANIKVSANMINEVMQNGRSMLTANAVEEEPYRKSASVLAYKLKSVICVPLKLHNRVLGCLYLDDPERSQSFSQNDLSFCSILAAHLSIAMENARLYRQVRTEKKKLEKRLKVEEEIIISSPKSEQLYKKVQKVAPSNVPVLILGETGSGKEMVAKAVHRVSGRQGRFVALNCAAIPENLLESELFGYEKGAFSGANSRKTGWLELGHKGTVLLDEIGDMGYNLQAKLLRVLQDKAVTRLGSTSSRVVDIRIVAATNKNLADMVKQGDFREDLYYRLAGVLLHNPPLRERREEVPDLARYFLMKFCAENQRDLIVISEKAMDLLSSYSWPGNVNQLKNVVTGAALLGDGKMIHADDLPLELHNAGPGPRGVLATLAEMEKAHIIKALALTKGNKKKAAQMLQISRDTIHRKIGRYSIT